ncbi:MAG: hypothetical protein IJS09_00800 [Treponema sp.]|nr:hypothetical protein [Treponema sp.]
MSAQYLTHKTRDTILSAQKPRTEDALTNSSAQDVRCKAKTETPVSVGFQNDTDGVLNIPHFEY